MKPDDICPRSESLPPPSARPLAEPIHLSSVYQVSDPDEAEAILSGVSEGYAYRRDRHPNADLLADKCRRLHGAEQAVICGSGMAALAAVLLAEVQSGQNLLLANQLYGRTARLLTVEAARLGIQADAVDVTDLPAVEARLTPQVRLVVAETISNPTLRVSDVAALANIVHRAGALLVVDNTFASALVCRPLEHGADLVIESLTKVMNGHSDVLLGLVCGPTRHWHRIPEVVTTWGLASAPFDCWLASRGIATLALRVERAGDNALRAAEHLAACKQVESVLYPGLSSHPDHGLARRQFGGRYGTIVTFTLRGGRNAATQFIRAASDIPFSPSLGELRTTLSHPQSTSHRAMSEQDRQSLGIHGGTIRLSVGIESPKSLLDAIDRGLAGIAR